MRKAALAVYVGALLGFALVVALPWASRSHAFPAGTPSPPPLSSTSIDRVPPRESACMTDLALSPQSERMRFQVGTFGKPAPRLLISARAPSYRSAATVRAGFKDNSVLEVGLVPPKHAMLVTLCIRNDGGVPIALYAAGKKDTARSRVDVVIAGKRVVPTPWVQFYESKPRSIGERLPLIFERMTVLHGFLGHRWIPWTLALLLAACPVLIGIGFAASGLSDRDEARGGGR
ncbi:MAG: hypothetical protein QOJ29_4304 [Thermoleophilaceae bacterium]|jgi:hypothetical protein|nr:hypothetical protein [Thermoleophilaceae bacterium]